MRDVSLDPDGGPRIFVASVAAPRRHFRYDDATDEIGAAWRRKALLRQLLVA